MMNASGKPKRTLPVFCPPWCEAKKNPGDEPGGAD
jgi:hypothetical protein